MSAHLGFSLFFLLSPLPVFFYLAHSFTYFFFLCLPFLFSFLFNLFLFLFFFSLPRSCLFLLSFFIFFCFVAVRLRLKGQNLTSYKYNTTQFSDIVLLSSLKSVLEVFRSINIRRTIKIGLSRYSIFFSMFLPQI